MNVLDGKKWHDVRSYCGNLWLSADTYKKILCRLYSADAVKVTPLCKPGADGQLTTPSFYAARSGHLDHPGSVTDRVAHLVEFRDPIPLTSKKPEAHIDKGEILENLLINEPTSGELLALLARTEYNENTKERKVEIVYTEKLSRAMKQPAEAKKKVAIRFLDENNKIMKEIPIALEERPTTKDNRTLGLIKNAVLIPPEPVSSLAIVWIETGEVLATKNIGKKPLILDDKAIDAKKVIKEFKDPIDISWAPTQVADPVKPEDVTYTVRISTDNGATWETVAVGYKPTKSMLAAGKILFTITDSKIKELHLESISKLNVKIIANDGFNSTEVSKDLLL